MITTMLSSMARANNNELKLDLISGCLEESIDI